MTQPPVPIIPGEDPRVLHDPFMPPPPEKRRRPVLFMVTLALLTTGLVLGSLFIISLVRDYARRTSSDIPVIAPETRLRQAYESCRERGDLSDGDHTLFLDMVGEDPGSGDVTTEDIACVLNALETPSYVTHAMDNTRALDGRQSETWGPFKASWSYHPDDGLDVLITER